MRNLVCRNALCSYMGIRMTSLSGASCVLCGLFLVEPPLPVNPPLTLSEQVAKLEAEVKSLKDDYLIDGEGSQYWHERYKYEQYKSEMLRRKEERERKVLLEGEVADLKKTIAQLQEKVKEQYYAGASAKTWHDSFIKERTESEKIVVELDKSKRGEYWLGETAKHWYEKYDFMCEALKRLV